MTNVKGDTKAFDEDDDVDVDVDADDQYIILFKLLITTKSPLLCMIAI